MLEGVVSTTGEKKGESGIESLIAKTSCGTCNSSEVMNLHLRNIAECRAR